MPYRIDLPHATPHIVDTLIDLGALDVEATDGAVAALMPDGVAVATVARALGVSDLAVSPAVGRDDESVWTLGPRPVRTRTLVIAPASTSAPRDALQMADTAAFGTGLHPTTALCLEAVEDLLEATVPERMLDVGTGSGILALAALHGGVRRAVGIDTDAAALHAAAENARLNGLAARLLLVHGGAGAVRGAWPLVVANIRAAELIELAPVLVRRVATGGRLVLSGIPGAVAPDVERVYRRLGMKEMERRDRGGWTALVLRPSW